MNTLRTTYNFGDYELNTGTDIYQLKTEVVISGNEELGIVQSCEGYRVAPAVILLNKRQANRLAKYIARWNGYKLVKENK